MRLLAIEDEPRIVELLRSASVRTGFVVDAVVTCNGPNAETTPVGVTI